MKTNLILTKNFFEQETPKVAQELLGKVIYHKKNNKIYRAIITETEAYHGIEDLACHCSKGKTPRTQIMFDEASHIYIYLIYGMYQMLNFVTMPKGFPAAILIRSVKNLTISYYDKINIPLKVKTNGPGKLTKHMQIGPELNKMKLNPSSGLWVVDENIKIFPHQINKSTRIGIDYAKEWKNKLWRFYI